jgi:hypothetical protein
MLDSELQALIDKSDKSPLLIIDFNVVAWRIVEFIKKIPPVYHTNKSLIKSVWAMILNCGPRLLNHDNNYRIVAVGDLHDDTGGYWRHTLSMEYDFEYKGNRKGKPEIFSLVYSIGQEYCEKYFSFFRFPGYEADDIAGFIRRELNQPDRIKIFYTVDNDWLQLVCEEENFYFYTMRVPKPKEWRDTQAANNNVVLQYSEQKLGYTITHPSELPLAKQENGDASDNIPPEVPLYFVDLMNPHPNYSLKEQFKDDTDTLLAYCEEYTPNKQYDHVFQSDNLLKKLGLRDYLPI